MILTDSREPSLISELDPANVVIAMRTVQHHRQALQSSMMTLDSIKHANMSAIYISGSCRQKILANTDVHGQSVVHFFCFRICNEFVCLHKCLSGHLCVRTLMHSFLIKVCTQLARCLMSHRQMEQQQKKTKRKANEKKT